MVDRSVISMQIDRCRLCGAALVVVEAGNGQMMAFDAAKAQGWTIDLYPPPPRCRPIDVYIPHSMTCTALEPARTGGKTQ